MRYQITEERPNGGKRGVSYGRGLWVQSRGSWVVGTKSWVIIKNY